VEGSYDQVGTFNGNPLVMAAARAALTEVLTEDAYRRFDHLRDRIVSGLEAAIERQALAAHVVSIGAKGCVTFSADPVRNYREFLRIDDRFSHCHWLFQLDGGVFLPPWGKAEQWMLSVQHSSEDAAKFLENFARFARALRS
jgi:glutamate-1-semialdehyde 2,1-aminomutase